MYICSNVNKIDVYIHAMCGYLLDLINMSVINKYEWRLKTQSFVNNKKVDFEKGMYFTLAVEVLSSRFFIFPLLLFTLFVFYLEILLYVFRILLDVKFQNSIEE